MRTLVGTDAIVAITLEKIELCIRRAVSKRYPHGNIDQSALYMVANEISSMLKEMRE